MRKIIAMSAAMLLIVACQESLEDRCAKEVKTYTQKNCPAKLDDTTILDSMTFERESHTLRYYYRITGSADEEGVMDWNQAKDALTKALKNTTAMKMYKDAGYSFAYIYRSEKDPTKVWKEVVITEKDYQTKQ